MNSWFKYAITISSAAIAGIVIAKLTTKKKTVVTSPPNREAVSVQPVSQTSREQEGEMVQNKEEPKPIIKMEKAFNNATLHETLNHFVQEGNEELSTMTKNVMRELKELELVDDISELESVEQISWLLTAANSKLMTKYSQEMNNLKVQLKARDDKRFLRIFDHYAVQVDQRHVNEGLKRIEAPRAKFLKNTANIPVNEYIRILNNLLIQYKDLKYLEYILPKRIIIDYNANRIAKYTLGKEFEQYKEEMKDKLTEEQWNQRFLLDDERSLKNYVTEEK